MSTIEPTPYRPFVADLLPEGLNPDRDCPEIRLCGQLWRGRIDETQRYSDSLVLHPYEEGEPYTSLEIRQYRGPVDATKQFVWTYCKLIDKSTYLNANGTANTVEAAAQAALTIRPQIRKHRGIEWHSALADDWTASISGDTATVRRTEWTLEPGSPFLWKRDHSAMDALRGALGYRAVELSGFCATPEEAFDACVAAPSQTYARLAEFVLSHRSMGEIPPMLLDAKAGQP